MVRRFSFGHDDDDGSNSDGGASSLVGQLFENPEPQKLTLWS